jgi:transposase InsO family protein
MRVHPEKPTIGIRASKPNEIWHIDATVIRLIDGTKAYLHAVIDNFSRRILAWMCSDRLEPGNTVTILLEAAKHVVPCADPPAVLVDGGVENFNSEVDELIESGLLERLLAMTDVMFSNSLIESWWRSLKHQWLFINSLDSVAGVEKLVAFYVREHNTEIPHSAFRGQTPDEMYFGTGDQVPDELEAARVARREARMKENRATSCSACG